MILLKIDNLSRNTIPFILIRTWFKIYCINRWINFAVFIIESTTYPGTCTEILKPLLEKSGLESGENFNVLDENTMILKTAEGLASDTAVGWFQGRMEFGPWPFGGQSILGNPH